MELLTGTSEFGTFSHWPCDQIGYHIAHGGVWEAELLPTFNQLQIGDVVVDVGANIGWWTIYAAKRGAHVYAFEALPEVFELLKLNVEQNGLAESVSMLPLALYDRCCRLTADPLGDENPAHQRFDNGRLNLGECYNSGSFRFKPGQGSAYDQWAIPLDFLSLTNVNLIKVDAEGADLKILRGAEQTILRCQPIICYEYLKVDGGNTLDEFNQFIDSIGYSTEQIDHEGLTNYGMYVARKT